MKKILFLLLIIILAITAYRFYDDWQRFQIEEVAYVPPADIDKDYYDERLLTQYYRAIEDRNGYVITQWSVHGIDLRTPEEDDEETRYAIGQYADKMAKIKTIEAKLQQSAAWKKQGLTNEEVKHKALGLPPVPQPNKRLMTLQRMLDRSRGRLAAGDAGPLVFAVQKRFVALGYTLTVDGMYSTQTIDAVSDFESKHKLYVDGVLDELTFALLFEKE